MSDNIIVALISGLCVSVPSVIATILSNKNNNYLINYQIKQLTMQVEKHNKVIERVYNLEREKAVFEESMKAVDHRLDDLEKKTEKTK